MWRRRSALTFLLRALISFRRCFPTLARRRGRSLHGRCLIVLPHHGITRLVTVILLVHFALLLGLGIAVTRIFFLVDR